MSRCRLSSGWQNLTELMPNLHITKGTGTCDTSTWTDTQKYSRSWGPQIVRAQNPQGLFCLGFLLRGIQLIHHQLVVAPCIILCKVPDVWDSAMGNPRPSTWEDFVWMCECEGYRESRKSPKGLSPSSSAASLTVRVGPGWLDRTLLLFLL